jgi:hypothetical protein
MSLEKLYNISAPEGYPQNPGKIKWSIPVSTITQLQTGEREITLSFSKRGDVHYIFPSDLERDVM